MNEDVQQSGLAQFGGRKEPFKLRPKGSVNISGPAKAWLAQGWQMGRGFGTAGTQGAQAGGTLLWVERV